MQVIVGGQNWSTRIQAVSPAYQQLQDWTLAEGWFFTDQDNTNASNVAVLGNTVETNLFAAGQSPIGQLVRIRNAPFRVIGVLAAKGSSFGGDQDDVVLIPFQTGQVRLFGASSINQIVLEVGDARQMDDVQQEVEQVLRSRHQLQSAQEDDFTIRNNNDVIAWVSSVSSTIALLLEAVAAVSLVVGGIGIMNIMLVSVTERTREIGIRLAIGARPADILSQFLVEAVVLSLAGGLIGTLAGAGAALLMPVLAGWATVLPWSAAVLATAVSAGIGIYPTRKASRLDPVVALRQE